MKKLLLFFAFFSFIIVIFGQNKAVNSTNLRKVRNEARDINCDKSKHLNVDLSKETSNKNNSDDIERYTIGKSGNVHSVLYPEQRCLFYDESSNHIIFTHGADSLTYTEALSNNSVITSYASLDELDLQNWNSHIILNSEATTHSNSFPSGVLYNPNAYENIDETFAVIAGPDYSPNGSYQNYFASSQMNNTNNHEEYRAWQGENDWARSSMTIVNDEVYIFGQDYDNIGEFGKNQVLKHYIGTTDDASNGFEWEMNTVSPDWLINEADGYAYALYTTYSAWKKDGSIGYMWMVGVTEESSEYGVYQPQVYYTTDGGISWEYIILNFEDNYTLQEFLPEYEDENGMPQTVRPSFLTADQTYPGVVDYAGRLHLFSNVYGSTRGDVTNPNEGNWVNEGYPGGIIFDFIIEPEGIDKVVFVDTIYTIVNDSGFGSYGWNHRLQAAKSSDEYNVFAIWSDQDDSEDGKLNFPDVKGFSYCAAYNHPGQTKNFTEDDLYSGYYIFPYISEYIPSEYSDFPTTYLPITTSVSVWEWYENDPQQPITHTFATGFILGLCINAIDEDNFSKSLLTVSQNKPNPVKSTAKIIVKSDIVAPVYIEIYNLLGQSIYSQNSGLLYHEKEIEIDLSNEDTGMYFYTVSVGENSITKKLLVE